jgi:hypothetical protein
MNLKPAVLLALLTGLPWRCLALPLHTCFPTIAEAVGQIHPIEQANNQSLSTGFWLEDLRRDPIHRKNWALVQSCDHPEQPPLAVETQGPKDDPADLPVQAYVAPSKTATVAAGSRVWLVRTEDHLRLQMPAIAQTNGAVGESIRVRIVPTGGDSTNQERFLAGVVRSNQIVEMEP